MECCLGGIKHTPPWVILLWWGVAWILWKGILGTGEFHMLFSPVCLGHIARVSMHPARGFFFFNFFPLACLNILRNISFSSPPPSFFFPSKVFNSNYFPFENNNISTWRKWKEPHWSFQRENMFRLVILDVVFVLMNL